MNLSRCNNGHFYDKEKFPSCPYCAQGVTSDDGLTSVFDESQENGVDATEPLAYQDSISAQIIGQPQQIQGLNTIKTVGRHENNSDETETLGGTNNVFERKEFDEFQKITPSSVSDDDDDHTVAFYDDIFSAPTSSKMQSASNGVTGVSNQSQQSPKRSVSTPCTGWVIALDGNHLGQDFRLKVGKNFVGRDASMDIVLNGDKSVSRNKHAIVVYEPKQHLYLVQPGESSELVYLNDEVVLSPMQLKAYDIITVGEVKLLFMPLCSNQFNWTDYLQKNRQ